MNSPTTISSIWTCSGSSTGTSQINPVEHQEALIEGEVMLGIGALVPVCLGRWAFCSPLDGASNRELQLDPSHQSPITNQSQSFQDTVWQPLAFRLSILMDPGPFLCFRYSSIEALFVSEPLRLINLHFPGVFWCVLGLQTRSLTHSLL